MVLLFMALGVSACDMPLRSVNQMGHNDFLVLDSHLDTPLVLDRAGFDITRRHDWQKDYAQVDLPRMQEGGLDGGFWVIYTAQGALTERGYAKALAHARHRNQVIDEMLRGHAPDFEFDYRA